LINNKTKEEASVKPIKKSKNENEELFDQFASHSSTECTGLITVPPENEDELENYKDIYNFGPPDKVK